VSASAFKR